MSYIHNTFSMLFVNPWYTRVMNLAQDLQARGLIEHTSADLEAILSKKRTVYLGVDPTADSMHVGSLLVVLFMKRLSDAGHKVMLLVGGGTGMIGDPKEKGERPLADEKTVARNKKALKAQMQRVIGAKVEVVDNADWLLKVKLVDFLRDIGKHFTINELVKRDIIKRRLETPDESISYTEFAYSLLQGYDYWYLNQKKGVDLQIGASDQWTNILSGVELIRRKLGKEAFALTTPLVVDSSGKKFGKSEGNAIWLDAAKTSPYQFFQFWFNQPDALVGTYLKYFTFMPVLEIDALMELHGRNPGKREAQRLLARNVTEIVHGKQEAQKAERFSEVLFGTSSFESLSAPERSQLLTSVPSQTVSQGDLEDGKLLVDLITECGFVSSKAEAKRLSEAKGIRLNGETVAPDRKLYAADFSGGLAIVQKGKTERLLVAFK